MKGSASKKNLDGRHMDVPPALNLSRKVWFAHIHKAAGTSFRNDLSQIWRPCKPVKCCSTQNIDLDRVRNWWFNASSKTCLLQSNEDSVVSIVLKVHRGMNLADLLSWNFREPALISMFRHPVARCRSHWIYEQQICHGHQSSTTYCQTWFLPRYGNFNDTLIHKAFTTQKCTDFVFGSFKMLFKLDTPRDAYDWISTNLAFWGITELYSDSLRLLYFQAGLKNTSRSGDIMQSHKNVASSNSFPPLTYTDDQLYALNRDDIVLYDLLRLTFERRVNWMHQNMH